MISLRWFLTLLATLFICVIVATVGAIGVYGSMANALDMAQRLQTQRAASVSERTKGFFTGIAAEVDILYELFESSPSFSDDGSVATVLRAFVANLDSVRDLTLLRRDQSNVMVYREDGEIGVDSDGPLDRESIEVMLAGRPGDESEGFEDLYMEPTDRRPVITYTLHLASETGQPLGTVYLDIDVTTLTQSIAAMASDADGYLFLMDGRGQVMAHPELGFGSAQRSWERVPTVEQINDPLPSAVLQAGRRDGRFPTELATAGGSFLTTVSVIDSLGDSPWYLVSAISRDVVLGAAIDRAWLIAGLGLVAMVLAEAGTLWLSRMITGPVGRLANAAGAVQRLDLEAGAEGHSIFFELQRAEQAFGAMLGGLRIFARYVPKRLVQRLVRLEGTDGTIGAESRELTILFTDLAGFTNVSAKMDPADLADMLNSYFSAIGAEVLRQGGTIDKFIGDALMAFWNAPDDQADHADRAIAAALAIQNATDMLNLARRGQGLPPLITRIGVHTGAVMVGNIGSPERMNYTIVGDAVNTAARLEALGKDVGCMLCVSEQTRAACRDDYAWRQVDTVTLRGRDESTTAFTIDSSTASDADTSENRSGASAAA